MAGRGRPEDEERYPRHQGDTGVRDHYEVIEVDIDPVAMRTGG